MTSFVVWVFYLSVSNYRAEVDIISDFLSDIWGIPACVGLLFVIHAVGTEMVSKAKKGDKIVGYWFFLGSLCSLPMFFILHFHASWWVEGIVFFTSYFIIPGLLGMYEGEVDDINREKEWAIEDAHREEIARVKEECYEKYSAREDTFSYF